MPTVSHGTCREEVFERRGIGKQTETLISHVSTLLERANPRICEIIANDCILVNPRRVNPPNQHIQGINIVNRVGLNEQVSQGSPIFGKGSVMENKSSNGWKFFALLFGALLAAVVGLYIYKQQNPDYDPWEEPWENSSSPVDLGLTKDTAEPEAEAETADPEAA